jgi:hypothetical protein
MSRYGIALFLITMGLFSLPATGERPTKPTNAELAEITKRGILLAGYDIAAWHASDAVEAIHPDDDAVKCYIARHTEHGWVVDFGRLNEDGDKFLVAYEAVQKGDPEHFSVTVNTPAREDAGWDLFASRAIDVALKDFRGESRPYNFAVLPASADGIFVYIYPAQVKENVYRMGDDVRYRMSADGMTIIEKRQLHKSIIESDVAAVPAGSSAAGGFHTHVLSDVPEDTDVFLVAKRHPSVPEFIGAGKYVYRIDVDGKITMVKK